MTQEKTFDAQEVGWQFVQEYYTFLNKDSGKLHCFYKDESRMTHAMTASAESSCLGQQQIFNKFKELDLQGSKVIISSIDTQQSIAGGILVTVLGQLHSRKENTLKPFSQTFFLAEQPNGYFVLNDIFRFISIGDPSKKCSAEKQTEKKAPITQIAQVSSETTQTPVVASTINSNGVNVVADIPPVSAPVVNLLATEVAQGSIPSTKAPKHKNKKNQQAKNVDNTSQKTEPTQQVAAKSAPVVVVDQQIKSKPSPIVPSPSPETGLERQPSSVVEQPVHRSPTRSRNSRNKYAEQSNSAESGISSLPPKNSAVDVVDQIEPPVVKPAFQQAVGNEKANQIKKGAIVSHSVSDPVDKSEKVVGKVASLKHNVSQQTVVDAEIVPVKKSNHAVSEKKQVVKMSSNTNVQESSTATNKATITDAVKNIQNNSKPAPAVNKAKDSPVNAETIRPVSVESEKSESTATTVSKTWANMAANSKSIPLNISPSVSNKRSSNLQSTNSKQSAVQSNESHSSELNMKSISTQVKVVDSFPVSNGPLNSSKTTDVNVVVPVNNKLQADGVSSSKVAPIFRSASKFEPTVTPTDADGSTVQTGNAKIVSQQPSEMNGSVRPNYRPQSNYGFQLDPAASVYISGFTNMGKVVLLKEELTKWIGPVKWVDLVNENAAFVEFTTVELAKKALDLKSGKIHGENVTIEFRTPRQRRKSYTNDRRYYQNGKSNKLAMSKTNVINNNGVLSSKAK